MTCKYLGPFSTKDIFKNGEKRGHIATEMLGILSVKVPDRPRVEEARFSQEIPR